MSVPNRAAKLGSPIEKWQVNIMTIVMIFRTIMITLTTKITIIGRIINQSARGEKMLCGEAVWTEQQS